MSQSQSYSSISEQLDLSLYNVELASYESLKIIDLVKPHWIISHVLEGEVEMRTPEQKYEVRSGDVMIHPPNIPFSELSHKQGVHQWLQLEIKATHHVDLFRLFPVTPVVTLSDPSLFTNSFDRLLNSWSTNFYFRELSVFAFTTQLLALLLGSVERKDDGSAAFTPVHDRFTNAIVYMRNEMANKISRDELAAMVNLHPVYFDRVFHKEYGVSPMQFLKSLRIKRAQRLLETTEATLESIAGDCGLGDAAYFSRVFQQSVGMSPGQYRKSLKSTKTGYIPPLY